MSQPITITVEEVRRGEYRADLEEPGSGPLAEHLEGLTSRVDYSVEGALRHLGEQIDDAIKKLADQEF